MTSSQNLITVEELRRLHRSNEYAKVIEQAENLSTKSPEVNLLVGLSMVMSGADGEKGKALLESTEAMHPDSDPSASDLALTKLLLGKIEDAEQLLRKVINDGNPTAVDFGRYAAVYVAKSDHDKAAEYYREAINREPGREHWHANLGATLMRQQKFEEALEHYDRALDLQPEFQAAIDGRNAILVALDKVEELIEVMQGDLQKNPDDTQLRVNLARALIQNERFTDAVKCLQEGLEDDDELALLKEEDPAKYAELRLKQITLYDELANQFASKQRHKPAYNAFKRVQELEPENLVPSICGEINAMVELGLYEAAEQRLEEAEELYPDENPIKLARTHMLSESGRYEESETILRGLVEVYPGNANLMANLAQTLMWTGNLEEAADWYEKASEINPQQLANLVRANRLPEDPAAIAKMEQIAENKTNLPGARESMAFALAELHDKTGDYDRAFHFLKMANDLVVKEIDYDPKMFRHLIDRIIAIFNKEYFDNLPPIRASDRTPVFVVGMPRSGTTLTEQILSSHEEVFGAGELDLIPALRRLMPRVLKTPKVPFPRIVLDMNPELREEAARYYLYGIKQFNEDKQFVVDKMPHNFANLGLIASILPTAKIIHIQRDPRDNAMSNYQQNFKAKHGGMGYAFQLETIAEEINNYYRVMAHWREVLPIPMFELTYEELVDDQEGMTRQLLDFIGVGWDDKVRDFHRTERAVRTASVSQVRQPMYKTSKQKWRRYEEHLGPLLENFEPAVLAPWDSEH